MTSVNKKEIDKFSKMANEWWDPEGKFKPLHKFNPTRIKYIKENIINNFKLKNKLRPLSGINILDIGCGGGLLSEPMSRMGANVTGIDASDKNIKIARLHSKKNKLKINYLCSSPEKLKVKKTIKDYQKFIKDNFNYVGNNFAYEARSIHYSGKKKLTNVCCYH